MIIKGKLIEIGDLEGNAGRGLRLDREGDTIQITGFNYEDCREVAKYYGKWLVITISEMEA